MNRTILRPDDMKVGQFITVLQGKIYQETTTPETNIFGWAGTGREAGEEETQYNGMVLQIIGIDFPYIAVKDLANNIQRFDLREGWIFKALLSKYVNAYKKELGDKNV